MAQNKQQQQQKMEKPMKDKTREESRGNPIL